MANGFTVLGLAFKVRGSCFPRSGRPPIRVFGADRVCWRDQESVQKGCIKLFQKS